MLSRGRSKDRNRKVTPPGPVYMSNEQFGQSFFSNRAVDCDATLLLTDTSQLSR